MNNQKLNYIVVTITLIAIMAYLLQWTAKHDNQIMLAAQNYEKCVQNKYKTTPSAWYNENGEYPICDNQ